MSDAPDPVLGRREALRLDQSDDALFYRQARLVVHIDPGAIAAVSALVRRLVPPGADVLDLMSSYRSHLPDDVRKARVSATGWTGRSRRPTPRSTGTRSSARTPD